jgi:hypothetical protein
MTDDFMELINTERRTQTLSMAIVFIVSRGNGLAQVSKDQQICFKNRGYIVSEVQQAQQIQMSPDSLSKAQNSINYSVNLVNMSLQQLWNIAYQAGFEDAQAIMKTDRGQH